MPAHASGPTKNGALSPKQRYLDELAHGILQPDPHQLTAIEALERLYQNLIARKKRRWWPLARKKKAARGVYLHGSVGRGKTHLMDLFYNALPDQRKQRWHYHDFMRWLHSRLRQQKNHADPLARIIRELGQNVAVLCLDEFLVNDIADAMLLAGLLESLESSGVTLVTTSNVAPSDLYANGLQRARFLPAIDWLQRHMQVIHLGGNTDFRYHRNKDEEQDTRQKWFFPANDNARACLHNWFAHLGGQVPASPPAPLQINGHWLPVVATGGNSLWTTFRSLCGENRHSNDYLELATRYAVILLEGIPRLGDDDNDAARRFITLVDVLYDRGVPLIASAETHFSQLYHGQRLAFEFQRTVSRLNEMQTQSIDI